MKNQFITEEPADLLPKHIKRGGNKRPKGVDIVYSENAPEYDRKKLARQLVRRDRVER